MGGCQPKGIGDVLQGGSTGGADIRVGGVGDDPPHGTGPGNLPKRGRKEDNGETSKETGGGGLVMPSTGGSYGGGGI